VTERVMTEMARETVQVTGQEMETKGLEIIMATGLVTERVMTEMARLMGPGTVRASVNNS